MSLLHARTTFEKRTPDAAPHSAAAAALDAHALPALGGTSRINQMAYTRGLPAEYDAWREAGRVGWAWEDVRPFFLKGEGAYGVGPEQGAHNNQGAC